MNLSIRSIGFLVVAALVVAAPAQSRDELLHMPIKDAMEAAVASGKLDKDVKLFFGTQKYPKAAGEFGTFTSNKKANFFGKSDKEACERAFLSAIISLQERAKKEGGNAVVTIISVYKNTEFTSETEYECGAGNVTGGVALRGKMAKLKQ
jgi:hypothetical protein